MHFRQKEQISLQWNFRIGGARAGGDLGICSSRCKIQYAGGTCLFCGQTGLGSRPEELQMILILLSFQAAVGCLGNLGNYKF